MSHDINVGARFELQAAVPILSQGGLSIFAMLAVASAYWMMRRRQTY
jgi:uncharacterized protein (TIGR03382 family)